MNILTSFLAAIAARIVFYYICKWLDGGRK